MCVSAHEQINVFTKSNCEFSNREKCAYAVTNIDFVSCYIGYLICNLLHKKLARQIFQ